MTSPLRPPLKSASLWIPFVWTFSRLYLRFSEWTQQAFGKEGEDREIEERQKKDTTKRQGVGRREMEVDGKQMRQKKRR